VAVAKEIQSVLLPATPGFAPLEPDSLNPATVVSRSYSSPLFTLEISLMMTSINSSVSTLELRD
jgi:hypothetical protein